MWLRKYMKWVVTQESWAASSFQILISLIKTINLTLPFSHAWIHKSLIMYCFTFLVAFCLWSAIFGGTPAENRFAQGFVIFTHRAFKKMNFIWILTFYLCLLSFFAHRESNCQPKKKGKKNSLIFNPCLSHVNTNMAIHQEHIYCSHYQSDVRGSDNFKILPLITFKTTVHTARPYSLAAKHL